MDAIDKTRRAILLFFLGLPIIMITLIIFLSISILNVGMIVLALGQVFIVPLTTMLLHAITQFMPAGSIAATDRALLVPSFESATMAGTINVTPSYWVAHIVFLCGYVFSNALTTYKLATTSTTEGDYDWKVANRKARSIMIMAVSLILMFLLIALRYAFVGTERIPGVLLALLVFLPLSYGWYQVAIQTGARNSDVFGIVQQMIPVPEQDKSAALCVPTAQSSGQ